MTGGAGYVGTVLVPMLLESGYEVRVLDQLIYTGVGLLAHFRNPRFEFLKGDVRDARTVQSAVKHCDVIVHLAAIVGFPACRKYSQLAEEVNVGGTKNIASAVGRDRLVLFGSTGSNYGAVTDQLCTEEIPSILLVCMLKQRLLRSNTFWKIEERSPIGSRQDLEFRLACAWIYS